MSSLPGGETVEAGLGSCPESPNEKCDSIKITPLQSASDITALIHNFIEEHEMDPNFRQDLLDEARNDLEMLKTDPENEDAVISVQRNQEARDMIVLNEPYAEVEGVVDASDDPAIPVATFRVLLLGTLFTIAGTALEQFFSLRMPSIGISTYVVQLLSMPLGNMMAKHIPTRVFRVRKWEFSFNPGAFSQKEHLLIAIMANVSFGGHSHGAYIVSIIQVLKLDRFYGEKVLSNSIPWQVTTLLATQMLGYGFAGIARRFLVYPQSMIWQRTLSNIALTKALHHDEGRLEGEGECWRSITRYRFFLICFVSMFIWFWVPNYLFEALAVFNWPTWISPSNVKLALIAGSTCGLGLNPLPTLDWNIATLFGDPIITPLFTLLNFGAGMALVGFIIVPIMYFNNVWDAGYLPINGNRIFDNTGSLYNISRIVTKEFTFNETAYYEYSVPLLSTTQVLNYTGYFCMYVAIPVHVFFWHRKDIAKGFKSFYVKKKRSDEFPDAHNQLMSAYPECPQSWYVAILGVAFVLAIVSVTAWPTGLPVWAIFLAFGFTLLLIIPIGMIAAMTNIDISTAILAMVIGGYALEGKAIANLVFKMFSFMSMAQALNFIADLKLAHYAKIPPRWAFAAQVYATLIAGFVALGVNHWVLRNIDNICEDGQRDRFTCPYLHGYFLSSLMWGVIGPRRLFGPGAPYNATTWAMPLAAVLPILVYFSIKRWPQTEFWRKVNVPIFIVGPCGWSPYNWSYMQSTLALAVFFNFYIKRRYQLWWTKYAYVMASSFMAAIGIAGLVMFFSLQKWNIRLNWWGNRVAREGVDQGGFLGTNGKPVRCANLAIPEKGFFDISFKWKPE